MIKSKKKVWLISKYATLPQHGPPSRQYFISKFLNADNCYDCELITSRSSAFAKIEKFSGIYNSGVTSEGLPYTILNGPRVNLGFTRTRLISWFIFELFLLIYSFIKFRKKPDIIYVSSLSLLTFFTGSILKKLFNCKLVIEVRDIWPATLVEIGNYSENSIVIKFLKVVEKIGYKNADLIIGSMPRLDNHVKNVIAKPFKFICIPMGFDSNFYNIKSEENSKGNSEFNHLLESTKIETEKYEFTIAYAGSIGNANYVNELLEANNFLDKRYGIFIIGNGPLLNNLKEKYMATNVYYLGEIDKGNLPATLGLFDVLVNMWGKKNIYNYGVSPNKWIDYMLSKRPILVSYDGYQSIINEAKCGWFIEANNPKNLAAWIQKIHSDFPNKKLDEMGQNGFNYAYKNLDYIKLVQKLCNNLEKL